ncbi:hypothetical protein N7468_002149 [Penicillium chermesinum]|uniref:Uncharacterized protein n=1 Tax=Penicillium chermesinum TaxID=63820 RepID=A0A9W9PJL8_9EURO|nr:uncharacterized protein N7468_002149 [Penicillium chermesinum]KAJ5247166.1 hypothetical protein N7468_002149 [Penicillium chermesinum]
MLARKEKQSLRHLTKVGIRASRNGTMMAGLTPPRKMGGKGEISGAALIMIYSIRMVGDDYVRKWAGSIDHEVFTLTPKKESAG